MSEAKKVGQRIERDKKMAKNTRQGSDDVKYIATVREQPNNTRRETKRLIARLVGHGNIKERIERRMKRKWNFETRLSTAREYKESKVRTRHCCS